jgi:ABC-type dipeptide/oligopeptide/nickel transport system permease component
MQVALDQQVRVNTRFYFLMFIYFIGELLIDLVKVLSDPRLQYVQKQHNK